MTLEIDERINELLGRVMHRAMNEYFEMVGKKLKEARDVSDSPPKKVKTFCEVNVKGKI